MNMHCILQRPVLYLEPLAGSALFANVPVFCSESHPTWPRLTLLTCLVPDSLQCRLSYSSVVSQKSAYMSQSLTDNKMKYSAQMIVHRQFPRMRELHKENTAHLLQLLDSSALGKI